MHGPSRFVSLLVLLGAVGCGSPADNGPFGPADHSALLSPFEGEWGFEFEKTLDAQKAAGASDQQIEQLRKMYSGNTPLGQMHPDMKITGNVAVSPGPLSVEYRLFAVHQHDNKVCGKAWHHEDRSDPGDMSKCYVRVTIKGDCLYMEVKMRESLPDVNDPDLVSVPPVEGGSAATCDAAHPAGSDWSDWMTYVFSRKH